MAAYRERRRRYRWPQVQLNIWLLVVLSGSTTCLGVFAWFMAVQNQLELGTPWLFPYMVSVGTLGFTFIILILLLAARQLLLPTIILVGTFILFTLWLTGLIETSLQLYGTKGNVYSNCQIYVTNQPFTGNTLNTLAWLTQNNICNCWKAAFAFEVVNTSFFFWMIFMAWKVHRDA